MKNRVTVFIIVFFLLTPVHTSFGSSASGLATEVTQMMNKAELITSVANQIMQLVNEGIMIEHLFDQYQNMLLNTEQIEKVWKEVSGTLVDLREHVEKATSLSFSMGKIDEYFRDAYPNYDEKFDAGTFTDLYQKWNQTVRAQCESALELTKYSLDEIDEEAELMAALEDASDNAEGRQEALQAGNSIAIAMHAQLSALKAIISKQVEFQATHIANENAKELARKTKKIQKYNYDPNEAFDLSDNDEGF